MHSRKTVPIIDLMSAANMELIRLDFKSSTLSRHSKEFRSFSNYCRENEITAYDTETGPQYFQHCYGLDIGNSTAKLTKQQLDTRCSIRFLDDIFQFGYALRYSHHDYTVPRQYVDLLEEYLAWCHRNNSSDGTIRVKRTKIRQFFLLSGWARNRTFRFNRCRNFGLHDHPVPLPSCNYPCIQQRFT